MTTLKSELRAVQYRQMARQASAMAEACVLDRAREQHELSATRWTELAETEERRTARHAAALLEQAQ